jgi:hypothetical protein
MIGLEPGVYALTASRETNDSLLLYRVDVRDKRRHEA